jgi:hypothetical protein
MATPAHNVKLAVIKVADRRVNIDNSLVLFVDMFVFEQVQSAQDQRE